MRSGLPLVILAFLAAMFFAGTGDNYVKGKPVKVEQEPAPVTRDEIHQSLARIEAQNYALKLEIQKVSKQLKQGPLPLPEEEWK